MSILQPTTKPVSVYRWDDEDAPALNGDRSSLLVLLKACLVTGYGGKEGLGWTMPFEDINQGVKCFRADTSEGLPDFWLRASNDTGAEATISGYSAMSSLDEGQLSHKLDSTYYYAMKNRTGRWMVIGNNRSFWLFVESGYLGGDKVGTWLFAGDTGTDSSGFSLQYLHFTGNPYRNWRDGAPQSFVYMPDTGEGGVFPKATRNYKAIALQSKTALVPFAGNEGVATRYVSPVYVHTGDDYVLLPGVFTATDSRSLTNYQAVQIQLDRQREMIAHGSCGGYARDRRYPLCTVLIATDWWDY